MAKKRKRKTKQNVRAITHANPIRPSIKSMAVIVVEVSDVTDTVSFQLHGDGAARTAAILMMDMTRGKSLCLTDGQPRIISNAHAARLLKAARKKRSQ